MPQDMFLRNSNTKKNCKLNSLRVIKSFNIPKLDSVYDIISGEFLSDDTSIRRIQNGWRLFVVEDGSMSTLYSIKSGVVSVPIASQVFNTTHRANLACPVNEHLLQGVDGDSLCYWYRLNPYEPTCLKLFIQERNTLSSPTCIILTKRKEKPLPQFDFEISSFYTLI